MCDNEYEAETISCHMIVGKNQDAGTQNKENIADWFSRTHEV